MTVTRNRQQKPWSYRRKRDTALYAFCIFAISYVMIYGAKVPSNGDAIITSSFLLMGSLAGVYGITAMLEDKNKNELDSRKNNKLSTDTVSDIDPDGSDGP